MTEAHCVSGVWVLWQIFSYDTQIITDDKLCILKLLRSHKGTFVWPCGCKQDLLLLCCQHTAIAEPTFRPSVNPPSHRARSQETSHRESTESSCTQNSEEEVCWSPQSAI